MNTYTAHHLSKVHHNQLIAKADQARLVKQAHLASRERSVSAPRRHGWLREAMGHLATRLMSRTGAHAGSH